MEMTPKPFCCRRNHPGTNKPKISKRSLDLKGPALKDNKRQSSGTIIKEDAKSVNMHVT